MEEASENETVQLRKENELERKSRRVEATPENINTLHFKTARTRNPGQAGQK